MYKGVTFKLWSIITAIIIGVLLFFTIILSSQIEKIYFSHQVKLMSDHAMQWKKVILSGMPPDKIQQEMEFWGGVSHYNIVIFDDKEVVRYTSDPTHSPVGSKSNWHHVKSGIENKETYYTGYNPELKMEVTATFLTFKDNKGHKYMAMVHSPTHDLMEMIEATRTTALVLLCPFFLISVLLAWYFSRLIAKPLIDIRKIAMGMAQGDFSKLATINRDDELGDLAKTMNILSLKLKTSLDSLSRANSDLTILLDKWKEFVADVSHELRTPLFLLQGYSEALIDGVANDEQTKSEYLTVINKETLRLQKMVNDLLEVESGLPLQKKDLSVFEIAANSVIPFEISAKELDVSIEVDEKLKKLPSIYADPDKLGEVIYNLVDNALRYTHAGGKILITGEFIKPNGVQIEVSDTGEGIPAEHLPHLFNRFYRADKSRSREKGGTGLGLSIVKKIIEQHGGTISVKSEINKGTSFVITLPI